MPSVSRHGVNGFIQQSFCNESSTCVYRDSLPVLPCIRLMLYQPRVLFRVEPIALLLKDFSRSVVVYLCVFSHTRPLASYGQIYRRGAFLEYLILSFLSSDSFGDLLRILHFISTPCLSDTPVRPLPLFCLSLLHFRCYLFLRRVFCCSPLLF